MPQLFELGWFTVADEHPLRNGILGTVVGGLILAGILAVLGKIGPAWMWLTSLVVVPAWLLVLLCIGSLLAVALAFSRRFFTMTVRNAPGLELAKVDAQPLPLSLGGHAGESEQGPAREASPRAGEEAHAAGVESGHADVAAEIKRMTTTHNLTWTVRAYGRTIGDPKPLGDTYKEGAECAIEEISAYYVRVRNISSGRSYTVPLGDVQFSYDDVNHRPLIIIKKK